MSTYSDRVLANDSLAVYLRLGEDASDALTNQSKRDLEGSPVVVDDTAYNAYPGLAEAANGDLLAVYYTGPVNFGVGNGGKIAMSRSDDGGVTWSAQTVIADHLSDSPARNSGAAGIMRCDDDTLVLSYFNAKQSGTFNDKVLTRRSTDNGTTWGSAVEVPHTFGFDAVECANPTFQIANGDLLMPLYGTDLEENWVPDAGVGTYVQLGRSDDRAVSWEAGPVALPEFAGRSYNEATIQRVPDGRLLLMARTALDGDPFDTACYGTYSSDEGDTWGDPVLLFRICGSVPASVRIDDELWVIVRDDAGKASYLGSADGGASWSRRVRYEETALQYGAWAVVDGDLVFVAAEGPGTGSDCDIVFRRLGNDQNPPTGSNPGEVTGDVSFGNESLVDADPAAGSALFEGGEIQIPGSPVTAEVVDGDGSFTLRAVIRPAELTNNIRYQFLSVEQDLQPIVLAGLDLHANFGTNEIRFGINNNAATAVGGDLQVGSDYLVHATYNGTTMKLYINGSVVTAASGEDPDLASDLPADLYVGGSGGATDPWTGLIAEAAFFSAAFSAGAVAEDWLDSLFTPSVSHERMPDELAVYVETRGGEVRIAGDEPNQALSDYSIASTLPGGDSTADAAFLARRTPEISKHAGVTFRMPDRTTVWDGRLEATPELSDAGLLSLSCMGHQALLQDAQDVSFLGVDSALDGWEEPPRARRKRLADLDRSVNAAFSVSVDEGGITIAMEPDKNVQVSAEGEVWYRAAGDHQLAQIQYIASQVSSADMVPEVLSFASADAAPVSSHTLVSGLALTTWTPAASARYFAFVDTPSSAQNKPARIVQVHAASVYGDHGLTVREIEGLPGGLWFSDVVAYLIDRFQPLLIVNPAAGQTIEDSSFVLPDAKWLEPTTLGQILEDGIAFEQGREWAVWGKTLHYGRRASMGRTWTLRRSEGARFIDSGESSEPEYNGVLVMFTENDGIQRWAGPPGSAADVTDASLADTDPGNPVNASSALGDRYLTVEVGDVDRNKAIELGAAALREALRTRFNGEVEVPRYAYREGQILPTVLMRADDWILDGDQDSAEPMPLSGVNYTRSRGDRPMTASIDLPSNRLDVALARLGVKPRRVKRRKIRADLGRMRQRSRRLEKKARRQKHKARAAK